MKAQLACECRRPDIRGGAVPERPVALRLTGGDQLGAGNRGVAAPPVGLIGVDTDLHEAAYGGTRVGFSEDLIAMHDAVPESMGEEGTDTAAASDLMLTPGAALKKRGI
jgi:hypothetical protein